MGCVWRSACGECPRQPPAIPPCPGPQTTAAAHLAPLPAPQRASGWHPAGAGPRQRQPGTAGRLLQWAARPLRPPGGPSLAWARCRWGGAPRRRCRGPAGARPWGCGRGRRRRRSCAGSAGGLGQYQQSQLAPPPPQPPGQHGILCSSHQPTPAAGRYADTHAACQACPATASGLPALPGPRPRAARGRAPTWPRPWVLPDQLRVVGLLPLMQRGAVCPDLDAALGLLGRRPAAVRLQGWCGREGSRRVSSKAAGERLQLFSSSALRS